MHQAGRQHEQSFDPCKAPWSVLVDIWVWYQVPPRASVKANSLPVQISRLPYSRFPPGLAQDHEGDQHTIHCVDPTAGTASVVEGQE